MLQTGPLLSTKKSNKYSLMLSGVVSGSCPDEPDLCQTDAIGSHYLGVSIMVSPLMTRYLQTQTATRKV
jgi:hypothetical protein